MRGATFTGDDEETKV